METTPTVASTPVNRNGFSARLRRWSWPLLYAMTVLAMLSWYEILPRLRGYWLMQGDWQFTTGALHTEKLENAFVRFENGSAVVCSAKGNNWQSRKTGYRLVPAHNFYLVTRTWTFGKPGRYYDADYIACIQDDKLYQISGLAEMDRQRETTITRLRRTAEVPAAAVEQIKNTP